MRFPEGLKYSKDHEWAKVEGKIVTIGITDHAQRALGDVVYVELPTQGRVLKKGETFGVVESIKAVSDLYAPVPGKVVSVNAALSEDPGQVNRDPHGEAWMIQVELNDTVDANDLMDSVHYSKFVETLN